MQKGAKTGGPSLVLLSRSFVLTTLAVWTVACIAAYLFAQQQNIPNRIVWLVLPAFLLELAFYIAPGFEGVRKSLQAVQPSALRALLVWVSGLAPYVLVTLRLGAWSWPDFLLLAGAFALTSFWYVVAKPGPVTDLVFLAAGAAVYLSRVFNQAFPEPARHVQLSILGKLAWIHVCVFAVLSIRGWNERYGFLPDWEEWQTGLASFLLFLPAGGVAAYLIHALQFRLASPDLWKLPFLFLGTFLAILWTVALAEEFVFRGFLQQLLARTWNSQLAALIVASLLFGAVHLNFARKFPNWQWVILATILGVFCGIAYWRTGSMRASMVTHALAVATWRTFFNG